MAFAYLALQLERAHARHDLVEGLRLRAFAALVAFHGATAGALVLGNGAMGAVSANLAKFAWGLPFLVLCVSVALFAAFVRWTFYTYAAKAWIRNVEGLLATRAFPDAAILGFNPNHRGTYYLDKNDDYGPLDTLTYLLSVVLIAVSVSATVAVAYGVTQSVRVAIGFGVAVALLQLLALILLRPAVRQKEVADQAVSADPSAQDA